LESITKNRQSPAALRAMVERAYGPAQVPEGEGWAEELGFGWFNAAYRIRLRDGARVVVKVAPPAAVEVLTYERGAMDTELAAIELLRTHTGVPVPRVDFVDRSRELCDSGYFFMGHVDADNLAVLAEGLPAAERDAYMERLGALNREINAVRGPGFGPLSGPPEPSWRRAFSRMFEDIVADGERRAIDLGRGYDEIRAVLAAYAPALDEVTEARLVEWDLWTGNVMVRDGAIAAVLDHERAFYGDPLMEWGFTGHQLPAFGDSSAFLRGYGMPEPTGDALVRRRLYCLYVALVMVVETYYRGHTEESARDWALERLDESMALFGTA
jgi:aminoglycoside phosphotransferase (APT) family kinase protein